MEQGELRAPVLRSGLHYRPLKAGRVFIHHPKIASKVLDARVGEALRLCRGQALEEMLPEVRTMIDYDCTAQEWANFLKSLADTGMFEGLPKRNPRVRLFDPGPAIRFVTERCRWLFTAPVVVLLFLLWIAALAQLLAHWNLFLDAVRHATQAHPLLSILLFYFCFIPIGLLHELAHGAVSSRFGGEVLEVGLRKDSANLYVLSSQDMLKTARARVLYLAGGPFLDMIAFFLLVNIWFKWPNYITLMFLLPQALFFLQFSYAMEGGSDLSRIVSEWTEIPESEGRWAFLKEFFKSPPKSAMEWKRAGTYLASIALQLAVAAFLIWSFRKPVPVSLWSGVRLQIPFWPPLLYLFYRLLRKGSLNVSRLFPKSR
ncbi:MAG TPA: hypothetical protein VKE24_05290 [Candidatus Acidoferrales bacterium]|nr:hypothetical protein [Candidatus Acidoferrales bacterium]